MDIDRPVFMIGMPRSGTTAIFEAFGFHEDLAWFPNYSDKFPRAGVPVAILPRFREFGWCRRLLHAAPTRRPKGLARLRRFVPMPGEHYPLWERWCGKKFRREFLLGLTATPAECRKVRQAVRWALRLQGKPRFADKITGPPRIGYLKSIFPDAIFVHIVRDGRAVINSLLNIDFWQDGGGYNRPFWTGGLPDTWEQEWKACGGTPMALAAIQWCAVLEVAQREREQLSPDQYFEIKYEDFVNDPPKVMDRVLSGCGLRASPRVSEYISQPGRFRSMNYKYLERFTPEEIDIMERVMGSWLNHYAYVSGAPV